MRPGKTSVTHRSWARALVLAGVALALAVIAWVAVNSVQAATSQSAQSTPPTAAVSLDAPLPPPSLVQIQQRNNSDGLGNILVTLTLAPDQLAAKQTDGTRDFVVIGPPDSPVIARDDGQGGDAVAGDGVFTAIANIDPAELQARAASDSSAIAAQPANSPVPVFAGRVQTGSAAPAPFDYNGFTSGKQVTVEFPVAFPDSTPSSLATPSPAPFAAPASAASPIPASRAASAPAGVVTAAATTQFQDRVLMIRDVGVVTDPARTYDPCTDTGNSAGVWTFNHLITQMANQAATGIDPAVFTEDWLLHWTANQPINGFTVPSRAQMQTLINLWKNGASRLDLTKAPLRLLAIIPRLDKRHTTGGLAGHSGGYGGGANGNPVDGGEARFIFGFVLRPGWSTNGFVAPVPLGGGCNALRFSVIFEYRVPKCDCAAVRDWARQWVNLATMVPGTNAYNEALEDITEQFVRSTNPNRPNDNDLGQLRTNEVALDTLNAIWELREFQLPQYHFTELGETNTQDSPHDSFNNNNADPTLLNWIRSNGTRPPNEVPLFFGGKHFLGTNPQAKPGGAGFFWTAPGLNPTDPDNANRHAVGLASCNGCHTAETGTTFVHVDPGTPGLPAQLSGFLTGITVADPAFGMPRRTFHDLLNREKDIKGLVHTFCGTFPPASISLVRASLKSTGKLPASLFGGVPPPDLDLSVSVDDMRRNVIVQVH
jgi:hypothetical protein